MAFFFAVIVVLFALPFFLNFFLYSSQNRYKFLFKLFCFFFLVVFLSNFSIISEELVGDFIENLVLSVFPFFFYIGALRVLGKYDEKFNILFVYLLFIAVLSCYKVFDASAQIEAIQGLKRQTNWGNVFGAMMPFVFLIKEAKFKFFVFFCFSALLIVSLKRSGLLVMAFSTLVIFYPVVIKALISIKNFLTLFVVSSASIVVIYFFSTSTYTIDFIDRAISRIAASSDDGGSGRTGVWDLAIEVFKEGSVFEIFFGNGRGYFDYHTNNLGILIGSAHNDFLNFLISYGVLGGVFVTLFTARIFYLVFFFYTKKKYYFDFSLVTAFSFIVYSNLAGVFHYFYFFIPLFYALVILEIKKISD